MHLLAENGSAFMPSYKHNASGRRHTGERAD
eukprot:CAMPEP_0204569774 /NCGR_PEP_ID=MMETSP0661-20131031/37943_1 /ASSEMBLY_ACC=CAM_ASM_000606 /TAXON_ID=109239 /ORGANISM="Alexandrium margalefi, Strain AMGDE01CS-322" /LENGTH=30 /DNA_ID= /DNA_START= /DNA_END= /DNA_ORIENTATION=